MLLINLSAQLNCFPLLENTKRCVSSCLCMISLGIAKQAGTWDELNVCSLHIRQCYWCVCLAWLESWRSKFQAICSVSLMTCPRWLWNPIPREYVVQLSNSVPWIPHGFLSTMGTCTLLSALEDLCIKHKVFVFAVSCCNMENVTVGSSEVWTQMKTTLAKASKMWFR